MAKDPIKLIAVLARIVSTRDGGSKITLECGSDSLDAVQALQRLNAEGDIALAIVCVPFEKDPLE